MLPLDTVRTITIWPRWERSDGLIKPMRRVLCRCSWEERSIAVALQTGAVLKEPALIRVFAETSKLIYVPPHVWPELSENVLEAFWTVDLTLTTKPLIAPFESEHEFEWGTPAQVTLAENAFRQANPGATLVVEANDNRKYWGSHIRLKAGD